jgi:tetratricopeptide (TPR) repeat protein
MRALVQVWRVVASPFLLLSRVFSDGFRVVRHLGRVNWLRATLRLIRWPFMEIARALRWLRFGLGGWWPRARLRHLVQGVPAVIVLLASTLPLVAHGGNVISRLSGKLLKGGGKNLTLYEHEAYDAEKAGDDAKRNAERAATSAEREAELEKAEAAYSMAELYYRALTQLDPKNDEFRYHLGLNSYWIGDHERANAIMVDLAPQKEQGYPPAHYWQGRMLMNRAALSKDDAEAAEVHLMRAIRGSPTFADAHMWLGRLYLAEQRLEQAEPHLLRAAEVRPELWLDLAQLHRQQGKNARAREDAERAMAHFQDTADLDLDNLEARLSWSDALMLLERFDTAAEVLTEGTKTSSDPRLTQRLSRAYLLWSESLRLKKGAKPQDQQALLVRSFTAQPTNPLLLRRLSMGLQGPSADAALVRGVLRALQAQGESLSIVELLLALDADSHGDAAATAGHLRKAAEFDPKLPMFIANLAISFRETQPIMPQEALALANLGLHVWPRDPDLLYARGYLLLRGDQWVDALFDLEAALAKRPGDPQLHRLIASVYKQLNMPEKAAQHLSRATAAR